MEKLQKNFDIDLHWRSFELHPSGTLSPQRKAQLEASRPLFRERVQKQYGLDINSGPIGIDSRPALIAEKYADSQGRGNAFHEAVMHAYWQEAKDVGDTNVLKEIATGVGLNIDDFAAILENPEYSGEVAADITMASEYGLDGVPALIFNNKYLVMGAQPYDILKQVTEQVQSES